MKENFSGSQPPVYIFHRKMYIIIFYQEKYIHHVLKYNNVKSPRIRTSFTRIKRDGRSNRLNQISLSAVDLPTLLSEENRPTLAKYDLDLLIRKRTGIHAGVKRMFCIFNYYVMHDNLFKNFA